MRRIIFTGTWRLASGVVEADVRAAVREVMARGDAIITGGATGVDYYATDEAMKIDPTAERLEIIIPAYLESYIDDYRTNWCQPPITASAIDALSLLLHKVKKANPRAFVEMPYKEITQEHYDLRHNEEVARADAVYAFQVNGSTGTQDTINKAKAAGLPIELYKEYSIEQ